MSWPWCEPDLDLAAPGPVSYHYGTGAYRLLGEQQWQYALPQLHTTWALTIGGRTCEVAGNLWLDRQRGLHPDLSRGTLTWMNTSVGNGDRMEMWSVSSRTTVESWATVLHPDGTQELSPVKALADSVTRVWRSPVSGQSFPTRWTVEMPSRQTVLTVTATPGIQEIVGPLTALYEGIATVPGTYLGRPLTGLTYVEMVGNWTGVAGWSCAGVAAGTGPSGPAAYSRRRSARLPAEGGGNVDVDQ